MNKRNCLRACFPIKNVIIEGKKAATLVFAIPLDEFDELKPGQYFMLWNPNDDEIPISISKTEDGNNISFTICDEGRTSSHLISKTKLELIGLRGPFGNGFTLIEEGTAILIAGGMGIAPLRYLIHTLLKRERVKIILIQGARTQKELYFKKEIEKLPIDLHYCTDDGSFGFKGFPTEILSVVLKQFSKKEILEIYSCGPEIMLREILNLLMQYSLESSSQFCLADRYIRCGFGICGSCTLDNVGLTICSDGPVFRGDLLQNVRDFGKFGRKIDGSKYSI